MKRLSLLLLSFLPLFAHCEKSRYVTSTATVWYITYPDSTKRIINYWTTGSRASSTTEREDDEYIINTIKDVREDIYAVAPKSTKVDSVYVNYNEIYCKYDAFDAFTTKSNSRVSRIYLVDKDGNVTFSHKQ